MKQFTKASVVVKQDFTIDDTLGENTPIPRTLLLANEQGLRWLADFFSKCAQKAASLDKLHPEAALAEHWHIEVTWNPVDYEYSDHIDITVVPFTDSNRMAVFERHNISKDGARRDSLAARSKDLIERAEAEVAEWEKAARATEGQ